MKAFLVADTTGSISSNLVEGLMNANHPFIKLDNFVTGQKKNIESFFSNPPFHFIQGNIRDIHICRQTNKNENCILHLLATLGATPKSITDTNITNEVHNTMVRESKRVKDMAELLRGYKADYISKIKNINTYCPIRKDHTPHALISVQKSTKKLKYYPTI